MSIHPVLQKMSDYLILYRGSRKYEAAEFENRGRHWLLSDITITVDVQGNIVIQKPALSSTPLFYANTPEVFIASSRWKVVCELLKKIGIRPKFNLHYVYNYLKFQCPFTDETFSVDIFYLRNGESVCCQSDGKRIGDLQSFNLGLNPSPPDLNSFLRGQLAGIDCANAFFHISSGLDSSILSILASEMYPRAPINAATLQTRGEGASDELETVYRLTEDFGFKLHVFDFKDFDIFVAGRELIESALGYPIAHPSHLIRFLMDREISKLSHVLVTGRGADESMAGYLWHIPEYADSERHLKRICVTPEELLRKIFRNGQNLPCQKPIKAGRNFWSSQTKLSLRRRIQYDLWTVFEAWNIIDRALARTLGVDICGPFLQPELMKALLALPDRFRIRKNRQKWLLRETFKNKYPEYILNSPKRVLRLDLQPYLTDFSYKELMNIIFEDSDFARKHLNRKGCEYLLRSTLEGARNFGWQIWSLYLCSVAYDFLKKPKERSVCSC